MNYFTGFSVVSSTLMSSSMVVVEFGWNIASVFFMLILRPNFDDALANTSTIPGSPLLSGKLVRCRLKKANIFEVLSSL